MSAPPVPDDLMAVVRASVVAQRRELIDVVGPERVAWLCLAPVWTTAAATAAGFPDLDGLIDAAAGAGWCERSPVARGRWTAAARADLLVTLACGIRPDAPTARERAGRAALAELDRVGDERTRVALLVRLLPALTIRDRILARRTAGRLEDPVVARAAHLALGVYAPRPGPRGWEAALPDDGGAGLIAAAEVLGPSGLATVLLAHLDAVARLDYAGPGLLPAVDEVDALVTGTLPAQVACHVVTAIYERVLRSTAGLTLDAPVESLLDNDDVPVEARAALLAAVAPALTTRSVRDHATRLAGLSLGMGKGRVEAAGVLVDLATAYARSNSDPGAALALLDRIADDRVRCRGYVPVLRAVLGRQPAGGPAPRRAAAGDLAGQCISRAVEALFRPIGTPDLDVAADLHDVLRAAGQDEADLAAGSLAHQVLDAVRRNPPDIRAVPALARFAAGDPHGYVGGHFRALALDLTDAVSEPGARAAARLRILGSGVHDPYDPEAAALAATLVAEIGDIDDVDTAAALLAGVIPHLPDATAADRVGVLEVMIRPAEPDEAFWMPAAVRPDVLAELRPMVGQEWLANTAAYVGRSLLAASQESRSGGRGQVRLPPVLRRWATLAAELDDDSGSAAARTLEDHTTEPLAAGRAGEALDWVESGQFLLPIVAGDLDTSVNLVARRAELALRGDHDRHRLEGVLARREQVDAFDALLAEPDDGRWALHYLGWGGVGKTTLLRYLTGRIAPERRLAVSRVDVGHLDPLRRPGDFLLEMLEELAAHADGGPSDGHCRRAATQLRALGTWRPDEDALAALDAPAMRYALDAFCAFLRGLPRRVVLMLDTSEELAKPASDGVELPRLAAAFRILERIHDAVPSLRVVFAGRRPLDRRGDPAGSVGRPQRRDYLRIHVIRGFDEREADEYLTVTCGLRLDPGRRRLLLERCTDTGADAYASVDRRNPGVGVPRYDPFDLARHTAALRDDPGHLTRGMPDPDVYVDNRVVRRLGPSARALLPVAVVLRRFNAELLAAGSDLPPAAFAAGWAELRGAEWLERRVHPPRDDVYLEVERTLLARLEGYYAGPGHAPAARAAGDRLAARLPGLVERSELIDLRVEYLDAAVRVLEPPAAAQLCLDLTERVIGSGAWGWARTVIGRLLGDDGAIGAARPIALALYTAALGKVSPGSDELTDLWAEVAAGAAAACDQPLPDALAGVLRRLELRGRLLRAAHGSSRATLDPPPITEALGTLEGSTGHPDRWRGQNLLLLGDLLGALAGALDHRERFGRDPDPLPDPLPDRLHALVAASGAGRRYEAFALMLEMRARWIDPDGDHDRAVECGHRALAWIPVTSQGDRPRGHLEADWPAPTDLATRTRLEVVRLHPPLGDDLTRTIDDPAGIGADHDRLLSALLIRRLAVGLVAAPVVGRITESLEDRPVPDGLAQAHDCVPPLRVTLSRAWSGVCRSQEATAALGRHGDSELSGGSVHVEWILDIARLEVARVFRRADLFTDVRTTAGRLEPGVPVDGESWRQVRERQVLATLRRTALELGPLLGHIDAPEPPDAEPGADPGTDGGPATDAVPDAGPRRKAEIAEAEGLLTDAEAGFTPVGDAFGLLRVTTLRALHAVRTMAPLDEPLRAVRTSYEYCARQAGIDVPAWDGLAGGRRPVTDRGPLGGWLPRVAVAARSGSSPSERGWPSDLPIPDEVPLVRPAPTWWAAPARPPRPGAPPTGVWLALRDISARFRRRA